MVKAIIKNVRFERFRGFETIDLNDFAPLTLISGKNNAGKSSILEGLFLLLDHTAPDSFVKINSFRGMPSSGDPAVLWSTAFYKAETQKNIVIISEINGTLARLEYSRDDSYIPSDDKLPQDIMNQFILSTQRTYSLQYSYQKGCYQENGHFVSGSNGIMRSIETSNPNNRIETMPFTQYINSLFFQNDAVVIEWFGRVELQGWKSRIIKILQIVEPLLTDILTISTNGQIQLYARIEEKLLPLKLAGDGLNKLLYICLAVLENPNSIILIDEIETGFHYSMYEKLWKTLAAMVNENGSQIIATTHSYECIVGAISAIKEMEMEESFCYYRIDRTGNTCTAHRYSSVLLDAAIEAEMEVR